MLAGGSTCFPGFADRLQAELAAVWDLSTAAGSSQSQWRVVSVSWLPSAYRVQIKL